MVCLALLSQITDRRFLISKTRKYCNVIFYTSKLHMVLEQLLSRTRYSSFYNSNQTYICSIRVHKHKYNSNDLYNNDFIDIIKSYYPMITNDDRKTEIIIVSPIKVIRYTEITTDTFHRFT
jgi:hypothetical protein